MEMVVLTSGYLPDVTAVASTCRDGARAMLVTVPGRFHGSPSGFPFLASHTCAVLCVFCWVLPRPPSGAAGSAAAPAAPAAVTTYFPSGLKAIAVTGASWSKV